MTTLFLKLLGVNAADAVHIAKASLAFRGGFGWGWFVLLLVALAALIWLFYRSSPVHISQTRKILLASLRVLFVGMLLLLLLRPVLALTIEGSIRRLLVMLVDTSSSMQIRDPRVDAVDQKRVAIVKGLIDPAKGLAGSLDAGRTKGLDQVARVDVVKASLKNERLNLLPRLDREFDVEPFTFAQDASAIGSPRETADKANSTEAQKKAAVDQFTWVDRLGATNPATAIGSALREIIDRKRGQPLAGVFLVTDGANNSGTPPREVASLLRQENIPLYIYGVGITSPRDFIVASLFAPDVTFIKDEVAVTVRVRAQGLRGETAEVNLKLNDQTVAKKTISITGDGEQVVPMRFIPQAAGEFELQASIDPRPDEAVKDNNSFSQHLKVIDAKIKVLLVDQSPRWEFRYLQAMLLRDRRVSLKCYLVEGDPRIAREGSPYLAQFPSLKEDLLKYDLVIYGDVDPKKITAAQLENLNEFVSRFGGAFVMVAGKRFAPAAYRRSVLEKMLPVEFDAQGVNSSADPLADKPIRLELTAAGRANPMLRLSDKDEENATLWKQLPPLYWVAKVSRAKPAAEVLLVDPDPARESRFGKMPVVAFQKYGLGQVMFVGTDNTWRWRRNVGDLYYTTLWGQIAQRVSLQHLLGISKRTQLTTDRQNYVTGDRVTIYARLYQEGSYDPVQDSSVKGIYGLKNGHGPRSELNLRALPEQPGLFRGEFVAPGPGAYSFFVEQDLNSPLDINVTEPKFELGETAMNEPLLRELATTTAGAFFREEDLYKLPDTINLKTEHVRSPLEVELWASPLYFLIMLLVVATEWVLRKMSYLK